MTVDRINEIASKMVILGWFAGLTWYRWISSEAIIVPVWALIALFVIGMFVVSIVVGAGLALLAGALTKLLTGKSDSSPNAFSWAAFIGMGLAFWIAKPALTLFKV